MSIRVRVTVDSQPRHDGTWGWTADGPRRWCQSVTGGRDCYYPSEFGFSATQAEAEQQAQDAKLRIKGEYR